jgi:hypothetical protein
MPPHSGIVASDPARAFRRAGFAADHTGQPVPIGGREHLSAPLISEHPADV